MKNKVFTGLLALIGVVSAVSLGAILLFIPATGAGVLGQVLFSFSLGLLLMSVGTFAGLYVRRNYVTEKNSDVVQRIALREAVLTSILVLIYLWLARLGALNVWIAVVALLAMMGLEYFFLTHAGSRT